MNTLGIQLLVVPFAAMMIYIVFIHYKKKHILKESFVFWNVLWTSFIIFSLFPQILGPVVVKLRFFRVLDLLMIVAFMILVVMNYYNYLAGQRLERQVERLIEKMTVVSKSTRRKK
jgi:hypothetical protein